jgi:DNA-directed RNA polymerase specialized sigma24 family protein
MRQRGLADKEASYERHKVPVLRLLATRCPWLAPDEREVAYHEAYAILLVKHREGALDMEGMHERQVRSYLMTTAVGVGLNAGRRGGRYSTVLMDDPGPELLDPGLPTEERAATHSETAPIRELVEELPERRRAVILAERDVHQRTLRAQRLPEHPPALRKALTGSARLNPEQVASLLPSAFLT